MADLPWLAVAPTSLAYSGSMFTVGPVVEVPRCHTAMNSANRRSDTTAARKPMRDRICYTTLRSSLPGLTRQSIFFRRRMDPRIKPAGDGKGANFKLIESCSDALNRKALHVFVGLRRIEFL